MRTRNKSYSDYGITEEEKKYIFDFCRSADDKQKAIIKEALSELNPYISRYIYRSLVYNQSYDDICKEEYIFMRKEDFYGYRRKGMEAIKRYMLLYGIWKGK